MHTLSRACAWIDRATLAPCPVEIPAYRMLVATTTTDLVLPLCVDHLPAAVATTFALLDVAAVYVERRVPA
jgi:hypothetical protein